MTDEKNELDELGWEIRKIIAENEKFLARVMDDDFEPDEEDGEEAEILVGNIRLRRPLRELELVQKAGIQLPTNVRLTVESRQLEKNEINLLGCSVDEAVQRADPVAVERFVDQL